MDCETCDGGYIFALDKMDANAMENARGKNTLEISSMTRANFCHFRLFSISFAFLKSSASRPKIVLTVLRVLMDVMRDGSMRLVRTLALVRPPTTSSTAAISSLVGGRKASSLLLVLSSPASRTSTTLSPAKRTGFSNETLRFAVTLSCALLWSALLTTVLFVRGGGASIGLAAVKVIGAAHCYFYDGGWRLTRRTATMHVQTSRQKRE